MFFDMAPCLDRKIPVYRTSDRLHQHIQHQVSDEMLLCGGAGCQLVNICCFRTDQISPTVTRLGLHLQGHEHLQSIVSTAETEVLFRSEIGLIYMKVGKFHQIRHGIPRKP